jgi:hypothetical protein
MPGARSPEQMLKSLDSHFARCESLDQPQLKQHWARGSCRECEIADLLNSTAPSQLAMTGCTFEAGPQ